jgi:hypothetical protein
LVANTSTSLKKTAEAHLAEGLFLLDEHALNKEKSLTMMMVMMIMILIITLPTAI